MKNIIIGILLLFTLSAGAQYHGLLPFDFGGGVKVLVRIPKNIDTTGKKFPWLVFQQGDGETGTNYNTMFLHGVGKAYANDSVRMVTRYDSMICIITLAQTDAAMFEQPTEILRVIDSVRAHFPIMSATGGMICGLSRGAMNTSNGQAWPTGLSAGFGSGTDTRWAQINKFAMASPCSYRDNSVFTGRFTNKGFRILGANSDGTCSPAWKGIYQTNLLSGGAHGTVVEITLTGGQVGHSDTPAWDSMFLPQNVAVDTLHNIYEWLQGKGSTPIVYTQARVYDIFDAFYGAYDVNTPWYFFDNQKSGHSTWDPKNGVTTDTTTVGNKAKGFLLNKGGPRNNLDIYGFGKTNRGLSYYVRDGFSRCFVTFDLTGLRNPLDTSLKFVVQEIQFKDVGDTIIKARLYNYDQEVLRKPIATRWAYDSRPDSLCNQLDSLTTSGTGSVVSELIDSTGGRNRMRYLRLMITATNTAHVWNANEIAIYGYYTADTSLSMYRDSVRAPMYTGVVTNHRDSTGAYKHKTGINVASGYALETMQFDGIMRAFPPVSLYDTATASGIPAKFKYWPLTSGDFTDIKMDSLKNAGIDLIFATKQGNAYIGGNVNADVAGDYENPDNYKRDSTLRNNLTKVYGRVTGGTNLFSTTVANGQNHLKYSEDENEGMHNGHSQNAMFWKSTKTYQAVKAADPSMLVVQPGMVNLSDTNTIKTAWWKSQVLTAAKIFPYDILNGHLYINTHDSLGGVAHTATEQTNGKSEPPSFAINSTTGWDKYADTLIRRIWKYVPGLDVWITEFGHDAFGTPPPDGTTTGFTTQYATPSISGLGDSTQVKAVWDVQQEIFNWASPLAKGVMFTMSNATSGTTQNRTQFFSMGKGSDKSNTDFKLKTLFPAWYFSASTFKRLKNYYFDSLMVRGGRTGMWIFRGHNYLNTDSVVYIAFHGSKSGQSNTQSIQVGSLTSIEEVLPSFVSETGTSTTLTPSAGAVSRTVTEKPAMYFGLESAGSPPSCTTNSSPSNGSTIGTQTTATVVWNSAATATSYDVYRGGVLITNTASTSFGFTGLTASTSYSWYIVPRNASGAATGCSGSATTFTTAAIAVPSCTTNGTVTSITQTTATLNWTSAATATGYNVFVGGSFVGTSGSTSYNATGLPANSTISWYVVPTNSSGAATGCSGSATTFNTLPNAPSCTTNSSPANGSTVAGTTTATLIANAAAGATSYQFWIDGSLIITQGSTTYNAFGFTPGTSHTWYVVPVNSGGAASGCTGSATTFNTAAVVVGSNIIIWKLYRKP